VQDFIEEMRDIDGAMGWSCHILDGDWGNTASLSATDLADRIETLLRERMEGKMGEAN